MLDIQSMISAKRVTCIKKLLEDYSSHWKTILHKLLLPVGSRARFVSFVEDFKKMLEGEQETDSEEQVNTEACGVTLKDLKKQKRINKMQLTKLYSRLTKLYLQRS